MRGMSSARRRWLGVGLFCTLAGCEAAPPLTSEPALPVDAPLVMVARGTAEWMQQSGTAATDLTSRVTSDATGVYTTGSSYGVGGWIRKTDFSGAVLWQRDLGVNVVVYGVISSGGVVYVTGVTDQAFPGNSLAGGEDALLLAYSPDGALQWARQWGTSANERGLSVDADTSGVYVSGWTRGALGGASAGESDVFVRRFDLNGAALWTRQFGTAAAELSNGLRVADGALYASGWTKGALPGQTHAGNEDVFLRKLDLLGNTVWTSQFGGPGRDTPQAERVAIDPSGIYLAADVSGAVDGDAVGLNDISIRKYARTGALVWARQFGSIAADYASGMAADRTGVYLVGATHGALPGQTAHGGRDLYAVKYDRNGVQVWLQQYGTTTEDVGIGVTTADGSVFVGGYTNGTFPGATSAGDYDITLFRLRP